MSARVYSADAVKRVSGTQIHEAFRKLAATFESDTGTCPRHIIAIWCDLTESLGLLPAPECQNFLDDHLEIIVERRRN